MRWRGCVFLLVGWGVASARAEAWPPLQGAVGGELQVKAYEELGLKWEATLVPGGVVVRTLRPGVDVEVLARPEAGGAWAWTVRRGVVDLTELWPLLRARAGEGAAGWSVSGRVELSGAGRWDEAGGLTGKAGLALREGWARSDELGVELGGIEADVVTSDLAGGSLPAGQTLRVARLSKSGTEINALSLVFGLTDKQVVEVSGGGATLLGGRVGVKPFQVALAEPVVNASLDVDAIQLGEVARLMPWMLEAAQGKLRGRVELSWDAVKGLGVRDGGLDIVKSDDAAFRLTPSPGLLTGSMPPVFGFMPKGWKWARWVGIKNPAYTPLKDIEMGREGLSIETFQVTFWPDGPATGRTVAIHIVGKPTGGKLVEEVVLDVNFHGPLTEAMGFGLNQEFTGFNFKME